MSAAVLLAKLITKVKSDIQLETANIYLWRDSMIVLSWIRKEPYFLKTFVANRIATIQDLTKVQPWRHVSSEDNPVDFISRGMDPEKLVSKKLWFEGPTFLTEREYPNRGISTSVIRDDFIC
ncbi:integrase catalytic domain-containing protein [Nephila pilipes]|uniref:Integrase catalytic domain-containing protein n=1 Tax=Nephila pilipes TaxID=299642 RepID=A0A8X6UCB9_NEPPI|nr:integrase catalytic domain-containing protein [Nephila pilipes]